MTPSVAVLDYEMSNLRSAVKALERLGADVTVAVDADGARSADAVMLPGVGHFGEAMRRIRAQGLDAAVGDAVERGAPVLGICLGLQLLFSASDEAPGVDGLGLIPGHVRRLATDRKLPQMGWNTVRWRPGVPVAPDGPLEATYYFVHAYAAVPDDPAAVLGTAVYGQEFCAAAGKGSVMGVQFHPEKSSAAGLGLLGRWLAWVRDGRGAVGASAGSPR